MKKIINDDLYGEIVNDTSGRDAWKKISPIVIPYNEKQCELKMYIDFMDILYVEAKYNLCRGSNLNNFSKSRIMRCKNWENQQKEMYKKFLLHPKVIMEKIEETILEDFKLKRNEDFTDEYIKKYFNSKSAKRIITANSRNKILALVKLKEVTLYPERLCFLGKNELYFGDFGIKVSSEGYITVGPGENIY